MENYTLSDLAAAAGNNNGWGGNWGGALGGGLIGYLLGASNNGGGLFGNNKCNAATTEDLANGFNFNSLQNKGNEILAAVGAEGRTTDNAICTLGYNSSQQASALSAQMANCCCDLKTAIHAEGEATRNMIQQNKIESLQAQVNQLQLAQAMCGVIKYPTATTYAVPSACFGYNTCGNCAY